MTRHRHTIAQVALLVYVLNPLLVTAQVIIHAGEGKLYNNGSVILSGTAQGDVDNLSSGQVARTGEPNQGALAGSYKLSAPVFDLGKDTVVVGHELLSYNDVQNRAFFQSAGLTGHLRNIASDVVGGVSTYEPISVAQGSTWLVSYKQTALAPNQDPATFDPEKVLTTTVAVPPTANPTPSSGTSESLARLYLPKPASITLVGPKPGTIVGQDVSISGDDLVLDNSSQPGTNTAGSAAVQPGQLEPMGPPAPTTVQVTAQSTDMQGVQGMEPVVNTPSPADLVAPDKFAGPPAATLGDMPNGKAPSVQPILVANSPASTAAAAAAAAAPDGRPAPLNLNLGAAQTAAQALGTMNAGNASVNWDALAPVAGSIKADTLTLELTGSFKNMGPLLVNNALTINAAKGIDNSGATIDAGILNINSHDGFLNNNGGTINAKTLTTDIAGQLNNTDGKISVVGNANLKTGDVVANNGVFTSANGNFTLDSTGNIALKASALSAQQGLLQLGALGNIDLGYTQGPKSHSAQTDRQEQAAVIIPGGCSEQGGGDASYTVCTSDQEISPGSWQEKSTETTRDTFNGTQLNAGQIDIRAGKDLNITASDLQSTGNIGLSAVGQVNVAAAIGTSQSKETQSEGGTRTVERWDGGENGSYYTEKQTHMSQQSQSTSEEFAQGSQVKAGGVLLIQSGADMHIDASQLQGDQGVALLSAGKVDITGQTLEGREQSKETRRESFFSRVETTTTQETQTYAGSTISSVAGNVSIKARGDVSAQSLQLSAGGDATLAAGGALAITSAQTQNSTQTGSDKKQSLQTQRSQIEAGANVTMLGDQSVTLSATDVSAGGNVLVQSKGNVELGYNTDTDQHNWTTSSTSRSWGGAKKKTTTTKRSTKPPK